MSVLVRPATAADRDLFLARWMEHLAELGKFRAEYEPTERTRAAFGELFDAVVAGDGVALVAEVAGAIVGVHLSQTVEFPWDLSLGRLALAWGTYVLPEMRCAGVATELRTVSLQKLEELGVRTVLFSLYPGNTAATESLRRWPKARLLHTTYAYEIGGH